MRRQTLQVLLVGIGLLAAMSSIAADSTAPANELRLACFYEYMLGGDDGKRVDTTGDFLLKVLPAPGGLAFILKIEHGAVSLSGEITEEQIFGWGSHDRGDSKIKESLVVNRFTGEFRIQVTLPNGSVLIHVGKCRSAERALF